MAKRSWRWQKAAAWVAVGLLAATALSCGRVTALLRKKPQEPVSPLKVMLQTDQSQYRQGDRVAARVVVRNSSRKAVAVQSLDVESVIFYLSEPGQADARIARPVFSKKEMPGPPGLLAGDAVTSRTFIFTTTTARPGAYRLVATYYAQPKGTISDVPPMSSNPIPYLVGNDLAVRRDVYGIVIEQDAVAIAKSHLGRPVADARAELVENAAGFLDWWVTLKIDAKDLKAGEEPYKAFFVSPYLATVIQTRQARPYIAKVKDETTTGTGSARMPIPLPPPPP